MEHLSTFRSLPFGHGSFLHRYSLESHILPYQNYIRYTDPLDLNYPLDLSLKSNQGPITPPCTPSPNQKRTLTPESEAPSKKVKNASTPKRTKVIRKLNFDEDKSSPVSGTIIRELGPDETLVVRKGDIDPAFNVVEITEEAKAELAKIDNQIGEYVCRLCKVRFFIIVFNQWSRTLTNYPV